MWCLESSKLGKSRKNAYLPGVQLILLCLILFQHVLDDLLQPVGVGLEGREDVLDGALNKNAIHHAKAFPVFVQRAKSFDNKSKHQEVRK